ncbi:hypothetical protein PORCAN_648 [Porphyromonas crevioricanis JCM 13913]|nr:hypothetical protein PORCAN_648 [Porphyromonas crevioricanis JCM 13913]
MHSLFFPLFFLFFLRSNIYKTCLFRERKIGAFTQTIADRSSLPCWARVGKSKPK